MKKICIYTCITGNYDDVKEIKQVEDNIDYFLFTNNKRIKSNTWKVIYIDNEGLDNIRLARKIKIMGHNILKNYDVTVWLDGASYIRKSVREFIAKYCDLDKYDLIGFKHKSRDCIYIEALECVKVKKDKEEIIKLQIDKYKKDKYPSHNGLIESTILIRDFNNKRLIKVMKDWFIEVCNFSYRDQLSFNYAAWKNKFNFKLLDINVFNNEYFGRIEHPNNSVKVLDNYYVYFDSDENFDYGCIYNGKYINTNNHYVAEFKCLKKCNEFKIEFASFKGILFSNLKIEANGIDSKNLVNYSKYFEYDIFDNEIPTLFVYGNFRKGQKITISIDMSIISEEFYLDLLKRFNISLIGLMDKENNNKSIIRKIIRKVRGR